MFKFLVNFFKKGFIKKEKMEVVHENDLLDLLESLDIYQDVLDGKYHCKYCGDIIDIDNLQAIVPSNRKISIICSNIKCASKLLDD